MESLPSSLSGRHQTSAFPFSQREIAGEGLEMAQQRELVALAEDSGSFPITHMAGDKLFVTPGAGEPGPLLSTPLQALHAPDA